MDELNKTAATEPEIRPEAAKLQDAPRRRVGSLTMGACLIAAGIFFLCYYFVPGFDWQLVVRIAPAAALVLLGCEVLFFAARPGGEEQHLTSQQHQGCRRGDAHHQLPVKARHKVITQEEDACCDQAGAHRQAAHPAAGGVLQLCSFRPDFRLRRCRLIQFVHRRPPHSPAVPALRGPPGSPGRPAER